MVVGGSPEPREISPHSGTTGPQWVDPIYHHGAPATLGQSFGTLTPPEGPPLPEELPPRPFAGFFEEDAINSKQETREEEKEKEKEEGKLGCDYVQ